MSSGHHPNRPSVGQWLTNWNEYDGAWPEKVRLLMKNNWLRVRHLQNCCGNDGEPGC